jgi:hypothetical protein
MELTDDEDILVKHYGFTRFVRTDRGSRDFAWRGELQRDLSHGTRELRLFAEVTERGVVLTLVDMTSPGPPGDQWAMITLHRVVDTLIDLAQILNGLLAR